MWPEIDDESPLRSFKLLIKGVNEKFDGESKKISKRLLSFGRNWEFISSCLQSTTTFYFLRLLEVVNVHSWVLPRRYSMWHTLVLHFVLYMNSFPSHIIFHPSLLPFIYIPTFDFFITVSYFPSKKYERRECIKMSIDQLWSYNGKQ